jgi:hypothetical protein
MTADTRLVAMESSLTVVQRARLVLQQWLTTGDIDARLWKYCPPQDHAPCRQICGSVGRAHESNERSLQFLVEWIEREEDFLGWLESLVVMRERERLLLALPAAKYVRLPECPPPQRGFVRATPFLYGRPAWPEEPPPVDWDDAVERLRRHLERSIPLRWGTILATEEAYRRASGALEMECMHKSVRATLDDLRKVIQGQTETMAGLGWPVELPARPTEDLLDVALSHFDWEPLLEHGAPAWDPRRGMSEEERQNIAEWERQWVDEAAS